MRRESLCDREICPHEDTDSPCPLDLLEQAEASEDGRLLQRALDVKAALNLGAAITLSEIDAEEFIVVQVIQEERDKFDEEQSEKRS